MTLAIWDDGAWQDAASIAAVICGFYLLVVWIAALVWTYRDIAARTRDQVVQAIAVLSVLVFNLPGLFLYLILRPKETLSERYDRQLEAEALLHEIQEQATCPSCRRKVEDEFLACPYCRTSLRTPCDSCSRPLASGWVVCPYCGSDRHAASASTGQGGSPTARAEPATPARPTRPRRASTATYTPPAKPAPASDADAST
ncbi:MAG TPA: zinc ribbon domain-containing protein [Dehalococcoidia bacterium]|jgi:RNA polymerase subunit RPABC4/transcription elongation factor Spt4